MNTICSTNICGRGCGWYEPTPTNTYTCDPLSRSRIEYGWCNRYYRYVTVGSSCIDITTNATKHQYKSVHDQKAKADRPQGEWILCADRLPKNDDWKIITILDEHGDTPYRYSDFGWYFDNAKCWIVDAEPRTDVLAWMPLPLPYGEREGER